MSAEQNPYQAPRAALDDSPEAAVDRALRRRDRVLLALLGLQLAAGTLIVASNLMRGLRPVGLGVGLLVYVAPPSLAVWFVLCRNHRAALPLSMLSAGMFMSLNSGAPSLGQAVAYGLALGILALTFSSARRRGLLFPQSR